MKIDKIYNLINKSIEFNKYIYDIDAISNYIINFCYDEVTELERIEILKKINDHNMQIYKENLEIYNKYNKTFQNIEEISEKEEKKIILVDEVTNEAKNNYNQVDLWDKIKVVKDIEKIKEYLPNKDDEMFNVSINFIILKYLEEEKILFDLLHLLNEKESEYSEISSEIKEKREIYNALILYRDYKKVTKKEKNTNNKLIFLKNINNHYCMERDLKMFPMETRQNLLILIESIESGKFKNCKSLSNNIKLKGSWEVKMDNIRVQFANVKDNIYIIESVFIKKCNKSVDLTSLMVSRHSMYLKRSEQIKDILDSDMALPFLKQDEDYYLELKKELNFNDSKKLVKNDKR